MFGGDAWHFPFFVLEKVEETTKHAVQEHKYWTRTDFRRWIDFWVKKKYDGAITMYGTGSSSQQSESDHSSIDDCLKQMQSTDWHIESGDAANTEDNLKQRCFIDGMLSNATSNCLYIDNPPQLPWTDVASVPSLSDSLKKAAKPKKKKKVKPRLHKRKPLF
jgi:hypothetical protein